MIAIIGAMEQEMKDIISSLEEKEEFEFFTHKFYKGKINNKDVVAVQSGIGKVDSGVVATLAIEHFDVDLIVNIGLAGGNGQFVNNNELVLINKVGNHDVDCSVLKDYDYGQLIGYPIIYDLSKEYIDKIVKDNPSIKVVSCLTGDCFVTNQPFIKERLDYYSKFEGFIPGVFDMELGAITQVAYKSNLPIIALKYISDTINSSNQENQYFTNKFSCSDILYEIIKSYLKD